MSPFARILQQAVEATPGAIGGAFAASDGEMVDSFTTIATDDWALLTAHYGVVLSHMHAAFGTWHFGGVEHFVIEHDKIDVMIGVVDAGYYALLALTSPSPLSRALTELQKSVKALRREMA